MIFRRRQIYYEHGERAGILKCQKFNQTVVQSAIPEICTELTTHTQTIDGHINCTTLDFIDPMPLQALWTFGPF